MAGAGCVNKVLGGVAGTYSNTLFTRNAPSHFLGSSNMAVAVTGSGTGTALARHWQALPRSATVPRAGMAVHGPLAVVKAEIKPFFNLLVGGTGDGAPPPMCCHRVLRVATPHPVCGRYMGSWHIERSPAFFTYHWPSIRRKWL